MEYLCDRLIGFLRAKSRVFWATRILCLQPYGVANPYFCVRKISISVLTVFASLILARAEHMKCRAIVPDRFARLRLFTIDEKDAQVFQERADDRTRSQRSTRLTLHLYDKKKRINVILALRVRV